MLEAIEPDGFGRRVYTLELLADELRRRFKLHVAPRTVSGYLSTLRGDKDQQHARIKTGQIAGNGMAFCLLMSDFGGARNPQNRVNPAKKASPSGDADTNTAQTVPMLQSTVDNVQRIKEEGSPKGSRAPSLVAASVPVVDSSLSVVGSSAPAQLGAQPLLVSPGIPSAPDVVENSVLGEHTAPAVTPTSPAAQSQDAANLELRIAPIAGGYAVLDQHDQQHGQPYRSEEQAYAAIAAIYSREPLAAPASSVADLEPDWDLECSRTVELLLNEYRRVSKRSASTPANREWNMRQLEVIEYVVGEMGGSIEEVERSQGEERMTSVSPMPQRPGQRAPAPVTCLSALATKPVMSA